MANSETLSSPGPNWFAPTVGAALLTFLIWASSPLLFSAVEPWDTPYPFYSITAFLGGGFLGYRFRGSLVPSFVGGWLGQLVALLTLPGHDRTWFALGAVTTAVGSLVVLAGAVAGALVRERVPAE